MSVIEKLDSVLALAAEATRGPLVAVNGEVCPAPDSPDRITMAYCSGEGSQQGEADAKAIAATINFLRDHGPAIRQDMIDARRYRWLRNEAARFKGADDPGSLRVSVTYAQRRKDGAGFTGLAVTPKGADFDAAIDAQLASDSEGGE